MTIRLNRYLAQCGLGSRRECDKLISSGNVKINGENIIELGTKIDPENVVIEYRGEIVKKALEKEYIAYHKSCGTMVTSKDPQGRETIYETLNKNGYDAVHLNYVGRLDRNSEGLLLLTNDGDLIHALTHPRFHIKKVYQVKINKDLLNSDLEKMITTGIMSDGQRLCAGAIRCIDKGRSNGEIWYEIDLYEGKNRQIRRMFEGCGYEIIRLKRTQFSVIKLRSLTRGKYRFLQEREIKGLKNQGFKKVK